MGALGHSYEDYLRGTPTAWQAEADARARWQQRRSGQPEPPKPRTRAQKRADIEHLRRVAAERGMKG